MRPRHFLLPACLLLALSLAAQTPDASVIYAEFARQNTILHSAEPHSTEYEQASQAMLQLYPQLFNQAAYLSQQGKANNALVFAKAYVDMAFMPEFADMHLEKGENFPTMVYFVASNYYNLKDYTNAATYLRRYIDGGEPKNRLTVYLFLCKTLENLGQTDTQYATIDEALTQYPTDQNLLAMAINARMEKGYYESALPYIDKALQVRPGDTKLTSLRGQCLEGQGLYEQAAGVYELLAAQQKTLNIYKHYALNLFNCAVTYYPISKERALEYLNKAIPVLQQIVANDPTSVQYTTALAMAYLYTDQLDRLESVNKRLSAMGAQPVGVEAANRDIAILSSDLKSAQHYTPQPLPQQPLADASQPQRDEVRQPQRDETPQPQQNDDPLGFRAFAQDYVQKQINQWQQKDPFETIEEYTHRVTEQTRNDKVAELMIQAKRTFLEQYEQKIRLSDFTLQPYDAENSVFLITSQYGDLILPVPRANNEARNFASNWMTVSVQNPTMDIAGDELVVRAIDFVTKEGVTYHYSDQDEAKYTQADINLQFDQIDLADLQSSSSSAKSKVQIQKQNITIGESDVDINVPVTKTVRSKTFAFIIGNEHYQAVSPVPYAINDAQSVATYCQKTLGIPQSNIRIYQDATFGQILGCIRDIKSISSAFNGEIDILFYYAGHGIPDEKTKSAFLLPIDGDGTQTETCYSVSRLYQELGQLGANSVIVMMDACFSGAQRGEGMLASARGIALKTRPDVPQGKMVAVSAATGEETAYPYEDKQHGMFTYYLLKHLQNTKGRTSMGDWIDYVQTQVRQQSVVINLKSQTPTVNASMEAQDWRKWNWK